MKLDRHLVASAVFVFGLSACDPVTIGTTVGGVAGLSYLENRTTKAAYQDRKIQLTIHDQVLKAGFDKTSELFVMVYQSEVMLVGYVSDADHHQKILEIANNIEGVKGIFDYLRFEKISSSDYYADRLLGLEISTRLSLEENLHAVNYLIRIHEGLVYVMGVAMSSKEQQRLNAVIAEIKGVRGMVSRVQIIQPMMKPEVDSESAVEFIADSPSVQSSEATVQQEELQPIN